MIVALYRIGPSVADLRVQPDELRRLHVHGDEVAPERCDAEAVRRWGSGWRRVGSWVVADEPALLARELTKRR